MPTPKKKKQQEQDGSSPKALPVHANYRAVTRCWTAHVGALRRWIESEDEATDVFQSLGQFMGRIPIVSRCLYDVRKLGALAALDDGLAGQLACDHRRECQRLADHLRDVTLVELNRAADDLTKAVEAAVSLVASPKDGWDPAAPAGACPMSPLEQITWMQQLNTMFFNELWRKEVLIRNLLRAVWDPLDDDDDDAATTARSAARLWPRISAESFIDTYFLEIVFTNHDLVTS